MQTVKMSMNEHEALMIAGNVLNRNLPEEKSKEIRQIINQLLNNTEIVSKEEAEKL
jgi:hypothetical protein